MNLKLPYNGCLFGNEGIPETQYSQAGQDIFVLSVLNGMRGGCFLDIGCNHPKTINNTYLLESMFGWGGILVDMNPDMIELCNQQRTAMSICADATLFDYAAWLKKGNYPNII